MNLLHPQRTNTVVTGVAKSGQVAPQGIVAHTETWDGRISGLVGRSVLRLIMDRDGHIRPMTMSEMVERGYFHIVKGPTGVRVPKEGIHEQS